MGFTPTYNNLPEREPLTADHYNKLVEDLQTAFTNIDGTEMAVPVTLAKADQNLDGDGHSIYGFKRWLGYGTADVCVRDVTGYGAVGDGSTDDTEAIQDAIDDLPVTGGVILFPPGTYIVSETIHMAGKTGSQTNVCLTGFGRASCIQFANNSDNGPMIEMGRGETGTEGQQITGLRFEGNHVNNNTKDQSGISMVDTSFARISGCWINDFIEHGITTFGSTDGQIMGCRITNCVENGISWGNVLRETNRLSIVDCHFADNTLSGIEIGPGTDISIQGCVSYSNDAHGIHVVTNSRMSAERIVISGCICNSNALSGIKVYNGYSGTLARAFSITGCACNSNVNHGIYIMGGKDKEIRAFAISSNGCKSNTLSGIALQDGVKDGTVFGNICTNNSANGITLAGVNEDIERISITCNVCSDDQAPATQAFGIILGADVTDCAVIANTTDGNTTQGIRDNGIDNEVAHNAEN